MRASWTLPVMVAAVALSTTTAWGQMRMTFPGAAGYAGGGSDSLNWLYSTGVQKELEIVDAQREALQKIRDDYYQQIRGMYEKLRDVPADERQAKTMEAYRELAQAAEQQIQEVLLPHQVERLRQIVIQSRMRYYGGTAGALTGDDLAAQLGITPEQRERLLEAQRAAIAELQEKTAQLQKEAQQKVLDVLTPEQRRKLDALVGAPFDAARAWSAQAPMAIPGGNVGGGVIMRPVTKQQ